MHPDLNTTIRYLEQKKYKIMIDHLFDHMKWESIQTVDVFIQLIDNKVLSGANKHKKEEKLDLYTRLLNKIHQISRADQEHPIENSIYEHLIMGLQNCIKKYGKLWGLVRQNRQGIQQNESIEFDLPLTPIRGQLKGSGGRHAAQSLSHFEEMIDQLTLSLRWDDPSNIQSFFQTLHDKHIPAIYSLSLRAALPKKQILIDKLEETRKQAIHLETQYELDLGREYSYKKRNGSTIDTLQAKLLNVETFLETLSNVQCHLYLKERDYEKALNLFIGKMIWGNAESMEIFIAVVRDFFVPEISKHDTKGKIMFFNQLLRFYSKVADVSKHHQVIQAQVKLFVKNLQQILNSLVRDWSLPKQKQQ